MQDYDKPHRNYDEQVSILRSRGLEIPDPAKAALFLSQISYYRFSAYAIPFWQYRDHFREGVSFPQLVQLYQLDEQLRERIDALLTCIEILFRTRMTYCLGRDLGPFGHYDSKYFYSEEKHKIWMERLAKEVNRSNETFIDHYKITYHGYPKLPIWMASEVMSMGRLSRLYDDLRKNFQTPLAKEFGIQPIVLVSWLHVLTVLSVIQHRMCTPCQHP